MLKVGSTVAFNSLPDATWFDVLEIDGHILTVRETGTEFASQTIDKSCVVRVRNKLEEDNLISRSRVESIWRKAYNLPLHTELVGSDQDWDFWVMLLRASPNNE